MQSLGLGVRVVTGNRTVQAALRSIPSHFLRGPFQVDGWLASWLVVHADREGDLALATVTDAADGALRLVLPFVRDTRAGASCWTALDRGVSDYNAPLLAPDFAPSAQTMRWIWARILEALPPADLVFVEKMPERIGGRRNPLLDIATLRPSGFCRHPLPLHGGLAAVRARFHGTRSLARKRRKLERRGDLSFAAVGGAAAAQTLDVLMGWRDRRYDASPATSAFYRRLLADTDLMRATELRLDGELIAGGFGLLDGGAFRLLVAGHDAQFGNWSPGLLAIEDMIAWAVESGLDEFDFTIGSEAYKFGFGVETERLWEIREPLRLRGTATLGLLGARALVGAVVRRLFGSRSAATSRRAQS